MQTMILLPVDTPVGNSVPVWLMNHRIRLLHSSPMTLGLIGSVATGALKCTSKPRHFWLRQF
jgi:hypothetical protein